MIRPAPRDPIQIDEELWEGWGGEVGWDIGANTGQSIRHMVSRFKKVYAFEPNPDAYNFLLACEFDELGVMVKEIAISDHNGEVTLAAIPELMKTGQYATPGTHGMEWDPAEGWDNIPHAVVPCRSIDSLAHDLGVPDFIKIDTEGHEGLILQGASHLIRLGRTNWLIEFHTPELHTECTEHFSDLPYVTEIVRHPHYEPESHMWYQHGWLRVISRRPEW